MHFRSAETQMIIDGGPHLTEDRFDVINPATGRAFAQAPRGSGENVDAAVAAARRAFPGWAATPIEARAAAIEAIAASVDAAKFELAQLLSLEQGKPAHSDAVGELMGSLAWIHATAAMRPQIEVIGDGPAERIELHRKPLGVVASITPWNYPVMITVWHIMPALLAGNTVVVKPSEYTPLATLRLIEIANAHLPHGVLNSVSGGGDVGASLAAHQGVDKVVFTGSTRTGRSIMTAGAANLKRLTLELGGNDAAIVLRDADVNAIAPKIFAKAFSNSGQTCAAIKRLYVHTDVHDALADQLAALARDARVGPGDDPESQFGPVQNRAQFDHVCALADDARAKGGRFLAGGTPMAGEGYFFPLSVVVDVADGARVVDEEQFGPVLPVIRYDDVEDALERANSGESGLGGSIWSSDVATASTLASRLQCGTAWVNDHSTISPDVPFGGAKQSGLGTEFGYLGLDEYVQLQVLRVAR